MKVSTLDFRLVSCVFTTQYTTLHIGELRRGSARPTGTARIKTAVRGRTK